MTQWTHGEIIALLSHAAAGKGIVPPEGYTKADARTKLAQLFGRDVSKRARNNKARHLLVQLGYQPAVDWLHTHPRKKQDHVQRCPICGTTTRPEDEHSDIPYSIDTEAINALELLRRVGVAIAFGAQVTGGGRPSQYSVTWAHNGVQPAERFTKRLRKFLAQEQENGAAKVDERGAN